MEVATLSSRCALWKDYYFIYNHRLLFVIALAFCRFLTQSAIVGVLSWYFTSSGDIGVVKSSVLTNAHGALSSILVICIRYAADSFIGRFKTIMFSNIAYTGSLVLLWIFQPHKEIGVMVVTIVLLALGTSGNKILEDALLDLVNEIDNSANPDETRSIARAALWSRVAHVSGSLISLLWVAPDAIGGVHSSWKISFLICIITMTLADIISGFGHKVYNHGELTERHVDVFIGVIQACFKKLFKYIFWCLKIFSRQVTPSNNMDIENGENEGIKQEITLHSKDKVVQKSHLKMLPILLVFSVVSIISATGSTFFLEQFSNLDTDNDIAVQIYTVVQDFSKFAIPFLCRWICCLPKNEKVKIGVGMICGVVSCTFAWQLEIYRLKEVSHLVNPEISTKTSISFLWLLPQFFMLGSMEGLTEEGLNNFYKSQVKEQYLQSYREEYIEFWMGIGKLLNILLIIILQGWFGDEINDSRLDKYYVVLVCVGSTNFIAYCFIAIFLCKTQVLANDDEDLANDDLLLDHLTELFTNNTQQNLGLAIDDLQLDHLTEQFTNDTQQNVGLANDDEDLANDDLQLDHLTEHFTNHT